MDLESMLKYGQAHLAGKRGEHDLLNAETWQLLHTPHLGDYACGWVRAKRKVGRIFTSAAENLLRSGVI